MHSKIRRKCERRSNVTIKNDLFDLVNLNLKRYDILNMQHIFLDFLFFSLLWHFVCEQCARVSVCVRFLILFFFTAKRTYFEKYTQTCACTRAHAKAQRFIVSKNGNKSLNLFGVIQNEVKQSCAVCFDNKMKQKEEFFLSSNHKLEKTI